MDYRSPGARSHASTGTDGSDGATAANYQHTPRDVRVYSPFTTFGNTSSSPAFSPYHAASPSPDWNTSQIIPQPCQTLISRLNVPNENTVKTVSNKPVVTFTTYFKQTYSGLAEEDWDQHLADIENNVFDPESFVPKQCYIKLLWITDRPGLEAMLAPERTDQYRKI